MKHDVAELERTAKTFRADMWQTVCEDAVLECGIEQATFGPVQVTVFQALGHDPMLNTVLGAAEAGAVSDGHLERAIEWADSFDVDYRVPISRDLPEMSLAESWLNWNGFEQGSGLVRYVRDAAMPQLPGVPGVKVWEIADVLVKSATDADSAWASYVGVILAVGMVLGAFLDWSDAREEPGTVFYAQPVGTSDQPGTRRRDASPDEARPRW